MCSYVVCCRNQQWLAIETPVDRLAIYNLCINAPDVDEKTVNAVSKAGASDGIRLQTQGCRPFSILLRFGAAVSAVDGVNPTNMNMMLDLHLPKVIKKKAEGEA
jgi:hypothetical protein